ncbi:hypothetical protein KC901_02110 [Patescibacteria group bacterium]|nr:hypothetical protein [Patescibacteria group bacterium]
MDQDLQKLLKKNHKLLLETVEIARDNQEKIKKIQAHIRRTLVIKTIYWFIIVGVTIGAFYVSKPYINDAVENYNNLKNNVDNASGIIQDPGKLFKDVNLIERLFGSSDE